MSKGSQVVMTDHSPLFSLPQQTEPCPLCQNPLVIRSSKNGPFLGCSTYPECQYSKALHQHENSVVKILEEEPCPECTAPLAVKNGRYGMFIGCTGYPNCHFIVQDESPSPSTVNCPKCRSGQLTERLSKYGKTFWGCEQYPDCTFLLNDLPVSGTCEYCAYPLLMQKKAGLYCAAKACQRKQSSESNA